VATVSRALTTPGMVSARARERVLAAAGRLGFSPNPAARALRRQRSMIVGAVIPTLNYAIYARLVNAFQDRMREAGHLTVVLTSGFDNAGVPEKVRLLIDRGAEGILVVGQVYDPELLLILQHRRVPVVSAYSVTDNPAIPSIGFDNHDAMLRALHHVTELGHRDILLLCGPLQGNDRQTARRAAFVADRKRRCQSLLNRIVECEYTIEAGEAAFREKWFGAAGFTCVLCCSDVLAFGVLAECRRLGVHVPHDLSVVGFDDLEFSARLDPPLTTLAVPSEEMGRLAADAMIESLSQETAITSRVLDVPLIDRKSTGPAPKPSLGNAHAREDALG
jgi:LacI family transcriptional regulator